MMELIRAAAAAPTTTYVIIQKRDMNVSVNKPATLGDRQIRLESLTPILSSKEREERKRDIENQLYSIFVKYMGS